MSSCPSISSRPRFEGMPSILSFYWFALVLPRRHRYTAPVNTLASNVPLVRRKDSNGRFRALTHRRISFVPVEFRGHSVAVDSMEKKAFILHERSLRRDRRSAVFIFAARLRFLLGRL